MYQLTYTLTTLYLSSVQIFRATYSPGGDFFCLSEGTKPLCGALGDSIRTETSACMMFGGARVILYTLFHSPWNDLFTGLYLIRTDGCPKNYPRTIQHLFTPGLWLLKRECQFCEKDGLCYLVQTLQLSSNTTIILWALRPQVGADSVRYTPGLPGGHHLGNPK